MSENKRNCLLIKFHYLAAVLIFVVISIPTSMASPWFHKNSLIDSLHRPTYAVVIDFDADMDLDIIVSSWQENSINWFENSGTGQFDERALTGLPDSVYLFNFKDLDDDDDLDLVLSAEDDNAVNVLENIGNNSFRQIFNLHFNYCVDIQVEDMDNDDDIDILLSGRTYIDYNYYSVVWLENMNMEFDSVHAVISEGENGVIYNIYPVDLDEDGDLDLFGSVSYSGMGYLKYYENIGEGSFVDDLVYWRIGTAFDSGDIDRDGDIDFIKYGINDDDDNIFSWWENDGNQNFEENTIINFDSFAGPDESILVDVDSDSDLDIMGQVIEIIDGINVYLVWHENDGLQDFTYHIIDTVDHYSSYITNGDINNDGYNDLVNYCFIMDYVNYYLCSPNDHQPSEFSLIEPHNKESYNLEQLLEVPFSWEESSDDDSLAEVMYYLFELELYAQENDTLIEHAQLVLDSNGWQGDITEFFSFNDWEDNFLRISWKVSAISEGDTVECERPFSIFIPEDMTVNESRLVNIPLNWEISSIYPNPFNPVVRLVVGVPKTGKVRAEIFDILGRRVFVLTNEEFEPGYHNLNWWAKGSSGIYFLRISSDSGWNDTRKLLFIQ
ncbi:MAG: FG-GAP-like repeat-containing protein [Candidatus Electryonea clarkiae]|nr:FG-GAP-like repeat-containing protein [Candidatus Electryonea clarkiae]MDP8288483.1 FG-GAP-like repeat-containing protein [Candidatus Electryonea clarkiae]